MTVALSVKGVHKAFGATRALVDASLDAQEGEVHALCGENGAGKSTLLSIIAGAIARDAGEMRVGGRLHAPASPAEARALGIALAPQEPTLALHLSVSENIVLGLEPATWGWLRPRREREVAARALASVGAGLDPRAACRSLSPAERQIVSIARAVSQEGVRVLILDEPTSSLPAADADRVLEAARRVARTGVAVLYVSHHLEEVVRVADALTVLRDGRVVHQGPMRDVDLAGLARHLVGRDLAPPPPVERERGAPVLTARGLAGARLPRSATLELHRGEVLGVAGLVGSGRTELARALFGLDPILRGEVTTPRRAGARRRSPRRSLDDGVGLASEDRKSEGLVGRMSVADNLTLTSLRPFTRWGLISARRQAAAASALMARLGIRAPGPWAAVATLSGGNQQKVALGRLLHHNVDVLLLDEPTRGIDIGSKEQIYALVDELARSGKAILWISSQNAELLRVCDRVAIMRRGVLGAPIAVEDLDEQRLLREIAAA